MAYIELSNHKAGNPIIMIFAEGTILKPKSIFSLYHHNSYIPINNCVKIIRNWASQGAEIVYCTSRKRKQALDIAAILMKYEFSGTRLYYREGKEKYKDIVEAVKPNILIEDDCKSIGGSWQMCITHVNPQLKDQIVSIIIKEFAGIDHLPIQYIDFLS